MRRLENAISEGTVTLRKSENIVLRVLLPEAIKVNQQAYFDVVDCVFSIAGGPAIQQIRTFRIDAAKRELFATVEPAPFQSQTFDFSDFVPVSGGILLPRVIKSAYVVRWGTLVQNAPDSLRSKIAQVTGLAVYGGIRVIIEARLENSRIPIQCDVGFGDAVTPGPVVIEFPALLDFPPPHLHSYPTYTVVAEKLEAMVLLGETNSRMKDFYDLWFLSRHFDFDGKTLVEAIRATFDRRKTKLPEGAPIALTDDFSTMKTIQWNAFLRRNRLPELEMAVVMDAIRQFAELPLSNASRTEAFLKNWTATKGWYPQEP